MTLNTIEYFIMLARERSFTGAARQLHITQQSLSAQISALEQELGTRLVVRHIPLELTYAGNVFLNYAMKIQNNITSMQQEFGDITKNQKGILKVGIAFTRGYVVMPSYIEAFQKKYPNIMIELVESSNQTLYGKLVNGEVDLAIANFEDNLPNIEMRELFDEEILLYISRKHLQEHFGERYIKVREHLKQGELSVLTDFPFVMGKPEDITGSFGSRIFHDTGITPVIRARSDNMQTLLGLTLRGIGACFCPDRLTEGIISPEQLAELEVFHLKPACRYQIRFAYRKENYQWGIISEFIKMYDKGDVSFSS